uniref:Uncharacterized protein n=1 Tax=Oryza sativa subsp. japonica TaxID=39947 RepID=Q6YZ33_ORYSJ|nr:hypothetical protein [Oryza sativa Japonica Group]BAD01458.1 hypothetical protein [Oryza sativa Japonica Group]
MSSFLKFSLSLISIALSSCSRWQQELGPAYLSTKVRVVRGGHCTLMTSKAKKRRGGADRVEWVAIDELSSKPIKALRGSGRGHIWAFYRGRQRRLGPPPPLPARRRLGPPPPVLVPHTPASAAAASHPRLRCRCEPRGCSSGRIEGAGAASDRRLRCRRLGPPPPLPLRAARLLVTAVRLQLSPPLPLRSCKAPPPATKQRAATGDWQRLFQSITGLSHRLPRHKTGECL